MELQDLSTPFDRPKGLARLIGSEDWDVNRDRLQQRELVLVGRALELAREEVRRQSRNEVPVAPVTITSKDPDLGVVETSDGRQFMVGWFPDTAFDQYRWATARAEEITDGNITPLIIEADSPAVSGLSDPNESQIALEKLWPRLEATLTARRWEDENLITVRIPELGEVRLPVSGEDPVYVRADSGRYVSFIREPDFPASSDDVVGEGAGVKLVGFELIRPEVSANTVASDCWPERITLSAPAPAISSLEEAAQPATTVESARPELSI